MVEDLVQSFSALDEWQVWPKHAQIFIFIFQVRHHTNMLEKICVSKYLIYVNIENEIWRVLLINSKKIFLTGMKPNVLLKTLHVYQKWNLTAFPRLDENTSWKIFLHQLVWFSSIKIKYCNPILICSLLCPLQNA